MKPCAPLALPGRWLLAVLLLLLMPPVAALRAEEPKADPTGVARWTVAATDTLPAPEGLVHQQQTLAGRGGAKATLHFVGFDQDHYAFRVFDQEPGSQASLEEVMRKNGCLAGTNGGYFQPDFEPSGLLMSDGKIVRGVVHAKLLSGALVVMDNRIEIRRNTRPLPGIHAQQAVQSGPFLVEIGKVVPGLNDERPDAGRRRAGPRGPGPAARRAEDRHLSEPRWRPFDGPVGAPARAGAVLDA